VARLSKAQIKLHREAEELLTLDHLDDDQREFVLDNWQESALHINSAAGAFFTPSGLAGDLALFSQADTVIDLCAGIGGLGLWNWWRSNRRAKVTCIEINPAYVAVGRKIFPEATWICASVETAPTLGRFDIAIGNPPFGKTAKIKGPRYSGVDDLAVVDIASECADFGTFILPSNSCPFEYSGRDDYRARSTPVFDKFHAATGIDLTCEPIDCGYYKDDWRGVSPRVEVVGTDFTDVQASRLLHGRDLLSALAA
jgi:predicted RNA methylase